MSVYSYFRNSGCMNFHDVCNFTEIFRFRKNSNLSTVTSALSDVCLYVEAFTKNLYITLKTTLLLVEDIGGFFLDSDVANKCNQFHMIQPSHAVYSLQFVLLPLNLAGINYIHAGA